MTDQPPSAISVAVFEILINDDELELSEEFDHAWGQAMFFLDPGRPYPVVPHELVGMNAAVDIMLEVSNACPETCDAVRALVELEWPIGCSQN